MKKLVYAFMPVLLVAGCAANTANYFIEGSAPEDGAAVYLIDQISSTPIDSAVVSDGTFEMKGKAAKDAFLAVGIDGLGWQFLMFNDGEAVHINVADSSVTGSALNTKLTECDKRNTAAYDEYNSLMESYFSLPEEEQIAQEEAFIPQYRAALKKYADFYLDMIEENQDNLVPVAFISTVPSLAGEEKFNALLASDAPFTRHPYVVDLKRRMDESNAKRAAAEQSKQAVIGEKFKDLEEAAPDGTLHKLSEYVGQGKWVLVDFWASWCGPCRAEMPNVVAAYKKYHDKGFDIVGLSFDQEKDPWVKAITEWEMPWIHLSDLKYWKTVAAEVYSVNAIPDNLLIDPEGTIVARGLRGAALEARLSEIFK